MSALERIKKQVEESPVILYMKGTPQMPMCGFSSRTVEALVLMTVGLSTYTLVTLVSKQHMVTSVQVHMSHHIKLWGNLIIILIPLGH
jgi:monothiol glutaredoxin